MLNVGSLKIENNIFVAPLSGITDYPFRIMIRKFGKGVIFSEMIASEAIVRTHQKTLKMAGCSEEEQPMAIQIVGNNPKSMIEAGKIAEDRGAIFVDINMGCPVKKIVSSFSGSALMKDLKQASDIISAVKKAVSIPVTVKFRAGWDSENINAIEFAVMAEENGASMVTVHGRTREQMYSGKADWNIIKKVKEAVKIPVVGNGDVFNPADAKAMIKSTNCDGVMIGRGIMGKPWLQENCYQQIIGNKNNIKKIGLNKLNQLALEHFDLLLDFYGDYAGLRVSRKHIGWYLKGYKNSTEFRDKYYKITKVNEARNFIKSFFEELKTSKLDEEII